MLILSIFIVSCMPATDKANKDTTAPDTEADDKDVVELPDSAMDTDDDEPMVEVYDGEDMDEDTDDDYDGDLAGLPAELAILMEKGKEKSRNINYLYRGPPLEFRDAYEYFIQGNQVKIIKSEPQQFVRGDYYNVVYIDIDTGDSTAYCEDEKRCDDFNMPFETVYDQYLGKLPWEWYDIIDDAYKVGSEEIFGRDANIYEFTYDGVKSKIWIDPFYGVPLQVRVDEYSENPTVYHYEVLKVGSLKMKDVEHQTRS